MVILQEQKIILKIFVWQWLEKKKGCIGEINAAIDPFSAKENICKHKYHDKKKQCEMCGNNCSLDLLDTLIYK